MLHITGSEMRYPAAPLIARLLSANLPRSKTVSVLTVDFGDHQRTILSSLREEREDPTEIEGRQAIFVLNLEPRKISGVTSEGMLYDIGYSDGVKPALAVPERPVPNGSRLG